MRGPNVDPPIRTMVAAAMRALRRCSTVWLCAFSLIAGCYQTDVRLVHDAGGDRATVLVSPELSRDAQVDSNDPDASLGDAQADAGNKPPPPIATPDAGEDIDVGWNAGSHVEAGGDHTCVTDNDATLYCWGADFYGQAGGETACAAPGSSTPCVQPPTRIPQPVGSAGWLSVSAGHTHSCGLTREGRLYCWGSNHHGELGDGTRSPHYNTRTPTPVPVVGGLVFSHVAAGENHTCAIAAGAMYCWGRNADSELGSAPAADLCGDDACALVPSRLDAHDDWSAVSAAGQITCGIRSGEIHCWGWSAAFQIDPECGRTAPCDLSPVKQVGTDSDWVDVNTWASRTCAIKQDGTLWCWGADEFWQGQRITPTAIAFVSPVIDVATGEDHTCAILSDGALHCWGSDTYGQLGDGANASDLCDEFGCVPSGLVGRGFESVSVGYFHTCALKRSGALFCWGSNSSRQLGGPSTETCETGGPSPESCATEPLRIDPR